MAVERTLSIIKPDATRRNLTGRSSPDSKRRAFASSPSAASACPGRRPRRSMAFTAERPFFRGLVEFMTSGPVVVQVLEGENAIAKNREVMGATNPANAAPGTIRKEFAESIEANSVHGSDAPETAAQEIAFFFSDLDIVRARRITLRCKSAEVSHAGQNRRHHRRHLGHRRGRGRATWPSRARASSSSRAIPSAPKSRWRMRRRPTRRPITRPIYGDLSRLAEMKRVAGEDRGREPKIDVLINNAGAVFTTRKTTRRRAGDDLRAPITWPISCMTNLLLDRLKARRARASSRTASDAHKSGQARFRRSAIGEELQRVSRLRQRPSSATSCSRANWRGGSTEPASPPTACIPASSPRGSARTMRRRIA